MCGGGSSSSHGARDARRLRHLRLLDESRGHDDPGHVLREHASARHRGRDRQLDLAHAHLPGHAVENDARRVAAARGDAITRRDAELGEIAAHHLRFEAGHGDRDLEQDVPSLGRQHVIHQRSPVEGAVLRFERGQPAGAQPRLAAVIELPAEGSQLAHHDGLVHAPLLRQRLLQQRQSRRRIGDGEQRVRRGRHHGQERPRCLLVGSHLRERARQLEARLEEGRVEGDGPLQMLDAVA